jgi:hypothetical protein
MKRLILVVIPALILCVANAAQSFAASSLGSECKNGFTEAKAEIKAMSDPAKKQQAQALARGAFTDLKSGEYQNCLDKLQQIKTLAH